MILLQAPPAPVINHTFDYINIAAILLSPLFAVLITRYLQDRREKRDHIYKNKFSVLAVVIGERHATGYSRYFITALNQVPMVFHKNTNVMNAYRKFIAEHKKKDPDYSDSATKQSLNDLIISMGKDLGYNEMNNTWIADTFYPKPLEAEYLARNHQNVKYLKDTGEFPYIQ